MAPTSQNDQPQRIGRKLLAQTVRTDVFACWACVAVANPKVKINTERMSFFMLCIASVLWVMCCDNRLNRSCVADTHSASNPLDRRDEEVTRGQKGLFFSADTPR